MGWFVVIVQLVQVEATVLEDLEVVADRLETEILESRSVASERLREHVETQNDDGSWDDIDHDDRSRMHWIPRGHLSPSRVEHRRQKR